LVRFSKQRFQPLFEKYPQFLREIARLNISRMKEARGSGERPPTSTVITLLPAPGAPVKEFAQQLARELAIYSSVLELNSANLDQILEMPGVAQAPKTGALNTRFSAWLSEQEEKYRFILLETDATATNWTRRCIRQSDQVITIGVGGADPAVGELEGLLYSERQVGSVPKRLVLIHPADCQRPSGTARWLQDRQLEMHHHVRLGNREDFRRLARFLSGSAVCLALGGGGARGFAHIGAFRAIREAGIPIDIVGGTSMGAVLGAELAMGVDPEKMVELNRTLFRNSGLLMDLTLPMVSFTTGRAYANSLKKMFDDVAIEDLWIPFFCVSSNISRATMAVHRTGLLRQKVRASSGVQGLFPPMVINGDLHVDGALFSNLPADVMKSVCQGVVIAVDVTPPVDLAEHTDYGDTISGWTVLWHRLFEGEEPIYSVDLGTIMQRSAEAASMASQRRVIEKMADFYLLMPVHKVKLMNFKAIGRLNDIGYVTARQKIEEWKPALAWTLRDSGTP
jgi:NTE family protein/lysophospholipid hydrolase